MKQVIYFVTGSQDLYGEATLRQVAANSKKIVAATSSPSAATAAFWASSPSTPTNRHTPNTLASMDSSHPATVATATASPTTTIRPNTLFVDVPIPHVSSLFRGVFASDQPPCFGEGLVAGGETVVLLLTVEFFEDVTHAAARWQAEGF